MHTIWSVLLKEMNANAPAAFQRFMNDVFSDLLIYSNDITQHQSHVKEVLKQLRKAGLYAMAEKCEFHLDSMEYLSYVLSPSGLTMSDTKVKTIQEWPEPKKVKDIQSFLGFTNFYRHFIFNYSDIVIPLTRLTRKNTPWDFDDNCSLATLFRGVCFTNWCSNGPQELGIFLDNQDSNVPTSKMVGVSLLIQPRNLLLPWTSWHQTRRTY